LSEYNQPDAAQYPPQYAPTETNIWALISLISGILAWLGIFGLGAVVAIITGHVAKSQIRASVGRMTGDGLATAGLVLGYINLALTVMAVCLGILVLVGVISGAAICPFIFGNN
jgi:dihydroorotate dehydrogenase